MDPPTAESSSLTDGVSSSVIVIVTFEREREESKMKDQRWRIKNHGSRSPFQRKTGVFGQAETTLVWKSSWSSLRRWCRASGSWTVCCPCTTSSPSQGTLQGVSYSVRYSARYHYELNMCEANFYVTCRFKWNMICARVLVLALMKRRPYRKNFEVLFVG